MSDPYEHAAKGKLKFKGGDDAIKKKKKKKDKKLLEQVAQTITPSESETNQINIVHRTKAEMTFKQMQEKNQTKRILEKANMTHKERVEKFNQHLDSLTEHFDIPKVSWTK